MASKSMTIKHIAKLASEGSKARWVWHGTFEAERAGRVIELAPGVKIIGAGIPYVKEAK